MLNIVKVKTLSGTTAEAVQFTGQNGPEIAKWCGGTYNIAGKFKGPDREVEEIVEVPSPYIGSLMAFKYDYIVKLDGREIRGRLSPGIKEKAFYPFHPAAFNSQYKEIKE